MWICLNNAFLSVVAHRDNPDLLLVRARVPGHIEAVFGKDYKVFTDPAADYFYRAEVPRTAVAQALAGRVEKIDYDNFKNSVKSRDLHDAYLEFWNVMFRLQSRVSRIMRQFRAPVHRSPHPPKRAKQKA